MVWGAVIGGVAGIASSLIGGRASSSASKTQQRQVAEANKLDKERTEAQFGRAEAEWKIDYWTRLTDFYWEQARVEQLRSLDKQKEADYYDYGSKLIRSTIENYELNTASLRDQYVTQEQLRATEVGYEYDISNLNAAADSNRAIQEYMSNVLGLSQEANGKIEELENQSAQLMTSLANEEALNNLEYDLALSQTILRSGAAKAQAGTRTAGGATAQRLANSELSKASEAYQKLVVQNQSRASRVGLLNNTMTDMASNQMGRIAIAMQDQRDRISYTSGAYDRNFTQRERMLKDVIIPGFQLSENQYYREMQSLQLNTRNSFDRANLTYREAEYFDPLKPILGLKPTYYAPTPIYGGQGPSTGQNIVGAINGALSGINQFDPGFFTNLFNRDTSLARNTSNISTPLITNTGVANSGIGTGYGNAFTVPGGAFDLS